MKTFTCKMCGKDFESAAHHADYCVDCRTERQHIRTSTYTAGIPMKQQLAAGAALIFQEKYLTI